VGGTRKRSKQLFRRLFAGRRPSPLNSFEQTGRRGDLIRSLLAKPVRVMRRVGVPVPSPPARSGSRKHRQSPPSRDQQSVPSREGCPRAHFLHIGKSGGTAVKTALKPLVDSGPFDLVLHRHPFTLARIPEGEAFFFSLRDPIERFVSGFSSRQREGRPRHYRPWGPQERLAFSRFETANALALALWSENDEEHQAAEQAMRSVQHLNSVWSWFGSMEAFQARERFLLKVLFIERLDDDFAELVDILGLGPLRPILPHDDVARNRTPSKPAPLDERAVANLRQWYAPDYQFLEMCRDLEHRRSQSRRQPAVPRTDGQVGDRRST
jgi:hypothetical protein